MCMNRCQCPERRGNFYNPEKIPYHWINWNKEGYNPGGYYSRCYSYEGMKEVAEKGENLKRSTGSSYGPDGDFEYYVILDYKTEKQTKITVTLEKRKEPAAEAESLELNEVAANNSS